MSSFAIFQKMNQKLEEGWKLTNVNCPLCSTSILGRLDTKEMYCVKCEMPVKMQADEEEEENQDDVEVIGSGSKGSPQEDEDDFDNMVIARQRELQRQKSDELSKKMGEKLLQGWAMLEETCFDCLFPLMKSRQGEVVCVGCGPVKDKKEKEEEKIAEAKIASPEPKITKKDETAVQKPIEQPKDVKTEEVPKKVEAVKEKKEIREKCEKREFKREHKKEKHHKRHMRVFGGESRSTEDVQALLELGNFDESLSLYSKMTSLLNAEIDKISQSGLTNNTEKVWEILSLQQSIDKSKVKIVKKLAK